jgi:hypothetical protein
MKKTMALVLWGVALPGAAFAQDWGGFGTGVGADAALPMPAQSDIYAPGVSAQPAPVAQAPGRGEFSLFRGSEITARYGQVRDGRSVAADAATVDTRHTLWLAPFLGSQIDLGLSWFDLEDVRIDAGFHLHALSTDGSRYGFFYVPNWDGGFEDRFDNYGLEGMFQALPDLTVEARVGRLADTQLGSGSYFGTQGFYALSPDVAVTANFQHTRLDTNITDLVLGAEYYLPNSDLRVSGGVGALRSGGDGTDLRIEFGATMFLFGEQSSANRARTFSRQTLPGLF